MTYPDSSPVTADEIERLLQCDPKIEVSIFPQKVVSNIVFLYIVFVPVFSEWDSITRFCSFCLYIVSKSLSLVYMLCFFC
ncbi:hypothetical protein CsatB_008063 [Cannabis sativa]